MYRIIFIGWLLGTSALHAQQTEIPKSPNSHQNNHCEATTNKMMRHFGSKDWFPLSYSQQKMNEWQDSCGLTEPIYRLRMLLNIRQSEPIDDLYDEYHPIFSKQYQHKMGKSRTSDDIPTHQVFDSLTQRFAQKLLDVMNDLSYKEKIICSFYSNDWEAYQKALEDYEEYQIKLVELEKVPQKCRNRDQFGVLYLVRISGEAGYASYFGKMRAYHPHAAIFNLNVGIDYHNIKVHAKFGYQVSNLSSSIPVEYDGQSIDIKTHSVMHSGAEIIFPIHRKTDRFVLYASLGGAKSQYISQPYFEHPEEKTKNEFLTGYLLHTGLVFNFETERCFNYGFTVRYGYQNFKPSVDVLQDNLDGHALSIGFIIGMNNRSDFLL